MIRYFKYFTILRILEWCPSKKNIFCIHKIIEKKINGIRSILTKASIPWTERILEESHWYHSTIRSEHYCSKYQKTALGDSERILWESLWISETMPFMQINNLFFLAIFIQMSLRTPPVKSLLHWTIRYHRLCCRPSKLETVLVESEKNSSDISKLLVLNVVIVIDGRRARKKSLLPIRTCTIVTVTAKKPTISCPLTKSIASLYFRPLR